MNKKLCIVIGASMNLNSLYKDQFQFLIENGFDVYAVSSGGIEHEWIKAKGVKTKAINFERRPSLIKDVISLFKLIWFFTFHRFDIVSISSPKASFLGAIAASITFQKNIIYTIRGRAYENTTGVARKFYHLIEKFICLVSTKVFCISHEIKDDFIRQKLCNKNKIFTIGSGSSNGVDLRKFTLTEELEREGKLIREKYNLGNDDILILYTGRIRKDKGINELVLAFNMLSAKYRNIHLLLQGEYEHFDPIDENVKLTIANNDRIYNAPWQKEIQNYLASADILAFPSHREGFGNVAIEASAMQLPVVGFDVVGCRESILDGVSGLLCKKIDYIELAGVLEKLICEKDLRILLGNKGRLRIEREFDSYIIWNKLVEIYNNLIKTK